MEAQITHSANYPAPLPVTGPARTYEVYLAYVQELIANGQHSGGSNDAVSISYTGKNLPRVQAIHAAFVPTATSVEALRRAGRAEGYHWRLIGESWCGDVASELPIIASLAAGAGIPLEILMRDENPELMSLFLTNGARSIPKLICTAGPGGPVLWHWGPRPAELTTLATRLKAEQTTLADMIREIFAWYDQDAGTSIERELAELANGSLAGSMA